MPRSSLPSTSITWGVARPLALQHPRVAEALEGDAALGLDHAEDVGADVADHPGGVGHRQLVHRLGGELHPADPLAPPAGHDLDPTGLRAAQQPAPVLAQQRERALVVAGQLQHREQLDDLVLDLRGVGRLLQERGEPGVRLQRGTADRPVRAVESLRAVEQVLDVERGDAHGDPWRRWWPPDERPRDGADTGSSGIHALVARLPPCADARAVIIRIRRVMYTVGRTRARRCVPDRGACR
jgi:hypothetical protein